MLRNGIPAAIGLLAALAIESCASGPKSLSLEAGPAAAGGGKFVVKAPVEPQNEISARRSGFSPTSRSVKNSINLIFKADATQAPSSWRVDIAPSEAQAFEAIRTFSGGAETPAPVQWDGLTFEGGSAPEGSYIARLTIGYSESIESSIASSQEFKLVPSPPRGSIALESPSTSLAELAPGKPIYFSVDAKSSKARISGWVIQLYDPAGGTGLDPERHRPK